MVCHCHAPMVIHVLGSQCHAALRLALLSTRQCPQECFANLLACANAVIIKRNQEERHDQSAIRLPAAAHLILIDIRVEQLLVAAVDDSWAVTGSKDMVHSITLEGLEGDGLAAQAQLLPLTQLTCTPTFEHEQGRRHVWPLNLGMLIAFLGLPYMCKHSARHAFIVHDTSATTEFASRSEVCKELHMLGTSLVQQTGEHSNMPVCALMWKVNRCPSPRAHRRYGTPSNCANNTLLAITCSSTSGLA